MLIEAVKIVSSVFPFIKEAFLWRDGADVDKPVTASDLRRRKIAVFTLFASLIVNYLAISKLFEAHTAEVDLKAKLEAYKQDQKTMVQASSCVSSDKIFDLVNKQIEQYIQMGLLERVTPTVAPPPEVPTKPAKPKHR